MDVLTELIPEQYRDWVIGLALLVGAAVAALIVHAIVYFIINHFARRTVNIADSSFVRRTRMAARLLLILLGIQLALPATALGTEQYANVLEVLRHAISIGLIASVTWLVIRAVSVVDDVIEARYPVRADDNLTARRIHTQAHVLRRTVTILIAVVGFAAILITFDRVKQFGASLLASAGIAGLVVGMAARPALSNLLAGLQLALSQPIRLDDVVIVEGEWGRIEEITTTFVVVRIWDQRRLVVPLNYFIEQPFQNWTRKSADLLGTIFVYADYTVPVQAVREELQRIVKEYPQWDGKVCNVQVTNTTERTMELRALVSAADSGKVWELRCAIRERLIDFLQREYPQSLPRVRAETDSPPVLAENA